MYGSDEEYQTRPHPYSKCQCFNPEPHCWWCGQEAGAAVHTEKDPS